MAANGASRKGTKKTAARKPRKTASKPKQKPTTAKKDFREAAVKAAAEITNENAEEALKMQEGFVAAQASRTIEIPLTVQHEDADGKLVTGVENFRATRWTMTTSMVLQGSMQKIQHQFAALLPRFAAVANLKEGETTSVDLKKVFDSENLILEGMMAVWPEIMKVCVATLYSSNKDRFESEEECRVYLEEHCAAPQMLELAILLGSMNQPPEAGKKGALANLFRTVGSQQP